MKALIAIIFSIFPVLAFGQQIPERFYRGIGISLYEIEENVSRFSGTRENKQLWFENQDGKFKGFIQVNSILPGGPAERAGLDTSYFIVAVDGQPVKDLGLDRLIAMINKTLRDSVVLDLIQTDERGNILSAHNKTIPVEVIDRAAWVPKDSEWGGASCSGDDCLKYSTKVSEGENGRFIYTYSFFNGYPGSITIQSSIVNLLLGQGTADPTVRLLRMDSMKTTTFVLESGVYPVMDVPSPVRQFFRAEDDHYLLEYFKKNYPFEDGLGKHYYTDQDGALWLNSAGTSMSLFVPAHWEDFLIQENDKFWERQY